MTLDSVSSDQVSLSWNVSALMQTTPHRYNVTTCTDTCDTLLFPYTEGSAFLTVNISNLTAATEYFIEISSVVVRPDSVSGENVTLHSDPTAVQVKTGRKDFNVITCMCCEFCVPKDFLYSNIFNIDNIFNYQFIAFNNLYIFI